MCILNGKMIASMPFEIGGVMSSDDYKTFIKKWKVALKGIEVLFEGKKVKPLLQLREIGLAVLPEWKMSIEGIYEVQTNKIIKANYKIN